MSFPKIQLHIHFWEKCPKSTIFSVQHCFINLTIGKPMAPAYQNTLINSLSILGAMCMLTGSIGFHCIQKRPFTYFFRPKTIFFRWKAIKPVQIVFLIPTKTGESRWKQVKKCENGWKWVKQVKTSQTCQTDWKWVKLSQIRSNWVKLGQTG